MIVQRGYKPAGNYHDAKRLAQPLSHYFFVMTNGYGAMPDYSAQLTPVDRWAVAAYIRALQLSQNAKLSDVPAGSQVENLKDIAQREGLPASYRRPVADRHRHRRECPSKNRHCCRSSSGRRRSAHVESAAEKPARHDFGDKAAAGKAPASH